jgi:protein phosphatase
VAVAFRYAVRSDVGLTRANNQDSAYAGPHLLVVADGMGGHAGGDVASSVAVAFLAPLDDEAPSADDAAIDLNDAVEEAREELLRRVSEEPDLAGLGTTITALLRSGDRLVLGHIGDSRAYLLRDGELEQVTTDHTFVQYLVQTGKLEPEAAERHPQRSLLLRVLGDVDMGGGLDISARKAEVGDRWLLCSDGLSGVVSKPTLAATLTEETDVDQCADALIELALRAGGPDNVTCVVADVVDLDELGDGEAPSTAVEVAGAAAIARNKPTRGGGGAAGRAASLTRRPREQDQEEDLEATRKPSRLRHRLIILAACLVILGAIAGGLYAAYRWTQSQYYVSTSDGYVAIFQGIPQDVGPFHLSRVAEMTDTRTDSLNGMWRDRLQQGLSVDDMTEARQKIAQAEAESRSATSPAIGPRPSAIPKQSATPPPSRSTAPTASSSASRQGG